LSIRDRIFLESGNRVCKNAHSTLDWNDLRLVLAVAREGSLSGAARALGVTHSTVFRRLGTIEGTIGTRLFERFRDGYAPTSAGEIAAASATRLEHEVLALERKLSGQDLRPSGPVRITTTDTLGAVLMRHLPAMRAAHPEIQPEIVISNAMANLTRREAEIAIRPTPAPSELLVGRRIADIAHAVYGSRARLARRNGLDLSVHDWIGLDDALAGTVIAGWMRGKTCRRRGSPAGSMRFRRCATRQPPGSALPCSPVMSATRRRSCAG
jgi:DNA-binding transcriptional LysR family regulator